jgi:ribosomal protein L16 Arg81 hydroxylase
VIARTRRDYFAALLSLDEAFDPERHRAGAVSRQFGLHAGDVAYVPRGCMHSARATESLSLHVTLGLLRYTWADLLLELAGRVALEEPAFRRSLPSRWAQGDFDRAEARRTIRELLLRLDASAALDVALDALHERFIAECPPPLRGQLEQLSTLHALNDASVVGARPGVLTRVRADEQGVRIDCYGRRMHLPPSTRAAVQYALARSAFRVAELPGSLDAAGRQALVRRLVREGLLRQLAGDILPPEQPQS